IALGARFDDRVTGKLAAFAPRASVIHVDIDPAEIGKNVPVHVPIVGDVKLVLQALLPLLKKIDRSPWLARVQELRELYPLRYSREGGLKPQYIIEELYRHTGGHATIATDVGQHQMWVAQYYRFKHPRSLISSGGLGTMGFGLPAAVGAQLGLPDRHVILVTGDGSFQMTMQELATVREQELPIKIFMINNRTLGMVRQLQEYYCEGRYMAVDFKFHPDFLTLARAYGIKGYSIETEEEAQKVIPEVLNEPGPVLVNCLVSPQEKVLPMVPSGRGIDETFEC
ncbi:MAG: thiamine pyrophosphate-dependent enzyme, partial [Desulfofundulus sp.]